MRPISDNHTDLQTAVDAASTWVSQRWTVRPKVGIVLGTGAGALAQSIVSHASWDYQAVPHFPTSTAIGHRGRLLCGELRGTPVIAMQGRFHLYEGYSPAVATMGIRVMAALGIEALLISNAAGGIHPQMNHGDVMAIDSHIDLMFRSDQPGCSLAGKFPRPSQRADQAYCPELIAAAHRLARKKDFPLLQGTYVGMLGPNYETRAEYRFLRKIGGDAVGMSTIPEVCLAQALGLRVFAVSIIANVAKPDELAPTSGDEVIDFAETAGPKLKALFEVLASRIAEQDPLSPMPPNMKS